MSYAATRAWPGALLTLYWCVFSTSWAVQTDHFATPKQRLQQMIEATRTVNYEGRFIYIQGQAVEAMHIAHSGVQGKQRMISLNGPPREVIVEDNHIMCLLPSQQVTFNAVNHNRSAFPISLPQELDQLERYYRFEFLAQERIAGRAAQIIAIIPRDELRYGYRLWLDNDTDVVLRSALVDHQGQFLEQLVFTHIEIKPHIDIASIQARLVSTAHKTESPQTVEHSDWQVGQLPQGFTRILHQRYPQLSGNQSTEHMVFSDGLATVSVFVELLDGTQTALLEGASKTDTINTYGVVVDDYQAIVVGEVPAATVEQIALSIQRR